METGRASRTAWAVASRRAAHQVLDHPRVLNDPIAVYIVGPNFSADPVRHADPRARAFRAYMVARSRYAEDNLADAVAAGVNQYVILGAGLDTFAYRNPFPHLHVFEVDFPSTQLWKREMLEATWTRRASKPDIRSVGLPDITHFVEGLLEAGFDFNRPAFFQLARRRSISHTGGFFARRWTW